MQTFEPIFEHRIGIEMVPIIGYYKASLLSYSVLMSSYEEVMICL